MSRIVAVFACVGGAVATQFAGTGIAKQFFDANPPPYEVINVAIENASPDPITSRRLAEERRMESSAMAKLAEMRSSFLETSRGSDNTPVIEVSLSSPVNAYPMVGKSIANLEQIREGVEADKMGRLAMEYTKILNLARLQITKIVAGTSKASFLKLNPIEPSIRVKMFPAASDEIAASDAITKMESTRTASETAMLDQAIAELGEFAKVYVNELQKALGKRSFLKAVPSSAEGYHRQVNVKLLADDNYPSIASLAEAMEQRRDVAEGAIRGSILDLQLQLAKSLNSFTAAQLKLHGF